MALEDKFYPENGSVLTKLDNFMIKSVGKIGEAYQHLTGRSYKDLVKTSYKLSAAGLGLSTFCLSAPSAIFVLSALKGVYYPQYESPLEEEIREETEGNHKSIGKAIRTGMLAISPIILSVGLKCMKKHEPIYTCIGAGIAITSASLVPHVFADYLTKANIPEPPKKTVWERAKEKLYEFLTPEPALQPVPVQY